MFDETYSLSLVTEFLKSKGIPFTYCNAQVGILFYNHGCRIQLNDTFSLSVQTHPDVAGNCFVEVALQNVVTKQFVGDEERFATPQQLFEHIQGLVSEYGTQTSDSANTV